MNVKTASIKSLMKKSNLERGRKNQKVLLTSLFTSFVFIFVVHLPPLWVGRYGSMIKLNMKSNNFNLKHT